MFPYPIPRNPQEALRQCNIAERVAAMHTGSDYIWYGCHYGVYGVARRSFSVAPDTAYTVSLFPRQCTCPDFTERGGYCKHLAFLWEQLEKGAAEGLCDDPADMVQCLALEAEEANRLVCQCDRDDRLIREAAGVFLM